MLHRGVGKEVKSGGVCGEIVGGKAGYARRFKGASIREKCAGGAPPLSSPAFSPYHDVLVAEYGAELTHT